jgi:hypothetical protein
VGLRLRIVILAGQYSDRPLPYKASSESGVKLVIAKVEEAIREARSDSSCNPGERGPREATSIQPGTTPEIAALEYGDFARP